MNTLALNLTQKETASSQVEAWKIELHERLKAFQQDFVGFTRAEYTLSRHYNHVSSRINIRAVIEKIINAWIESRCAEVTSNTENISHFTIVPDRLTRGIGHYHFPLTRSSYDPDPTLEDGT